MKRLIITGDDFGLAVPINEAIERAHREGILTSASLMTGSPAAPDAIERARRLPTLRVGLHVTVVRGRPVLPPENIPAVVDPDGVLPRDLFRAGVKFFFSRAARQQLEAEIRAQFEAFRASGLPLDHVDAHNHLHYHPTVFSLIVRIGRDYGMRAVRIPYEPVWRSWCAARNARRGTSLLTRLAWSLFLYPWLAVLRFRARSEGLITNDAMFGMTDSGHMTEDRVIAIVENLPDGVSEIYFHPATAMWDEGDALTGGYERRQELAALTSGRVKAALRQRGIECIAFGDIDAAGATPSAAGTA